MIGDILALQLAVLQQFGQVPEKRLLRFADALGHLEIKSRRGLEYVADPLIEIGTDQHIRGPGSK
jgi:hypothetical protein